MTRKRRRSEKLRTIKKTRGDYSYLDGVDFKDAGLTRGERAITWIQEYCYIPEGKLVGRQVKLTNWQCRELAKIYDNPVGTRRAILSFGRKNGKTALASFILLLHLCGPEHKANSQLYSAAMSRDQAAIIFSLAAKIVRMSPILSTRIQIRDTAKELLCPKLGTRYKALSAEASTAFGLSPALIVFDELGQCKGPRSELYEALETATAGQEEPLTIVISTQAATDNDLLSILIDDAKALNDPHVTLSLYTAAPEIADAFSEEAIRAANPAFDHFQNQKEVLAMAADAKRMPARQAEYENLILNRRVEINNPFVSTALWRACNGEVADLHGVPLYAGLDLSSVSDLTAFVLVGKIDQFWHVMPTFWLPAEGLREKAKVARLPFDIWADKGFLKVTPGATISYEYVAAYMRKIFSEYRIEKIGFDKWNMRHFTPWLKKAGFNDSELEQKWVEFGQGTQSMSPALRDLEQVVKEKLLRHGDHPVLAMCANCAVVEGKDDANRKLSKNHSRGRIDGMVALAMAFGVCPLTKPVDVAALIG
jgi:phage terminase large subunit-like protein